MALQLGVIKLLMGFTLVLMTFVGGLLPLKLNNNEVIMSLGNILSSGVFLGTGLLHMIPEATDDITETIDEKWKLSYLLCGCGLLTIVIFEEIVVVWQRRLSYRHLQQKIGAYSSFVSGRYSTRASKRFSTRSHISHVSVDSEREGESRSLIEDAQAECSSIIAQTVVESLYPRTCLVHHPFVLHAPPPLPTAGGFVVGSPSKAMSLPSSLNPSPESSPRASLIQPESEYCPPQPHYHYIPESKTIEFQDHDHAHDHAHAHPHVDLKNPVQNPPTGAAKPINDSEEKSHAKHGDKHSDKQSGKHGDKHEEKHDDKKGHDGHEHEIPKEMLSSGADSPYLAYVLVMALSVHSFFEAAALGSSTDFSGAISLWVAISAHKVLSSFALGSSLLRAEVSRSTLLRLLACFCLTTVIGIVLGYVLTEGTSADTADFISGCANSFAAGTFFYIGLCDILPKELSVPTAEIKQVLAKLACFVFGFSAMSCLAIFFG